jgi:flagella basal body P-ring formation protein FlgA
MRSEWTDTPSDVMRGETVRVEVRYGAAMLAFDGQAQGSGNAGQTVAVVNPRTRKRFQARIDGPGHVSLEGASLEGASPEGASLKGASL